MELSSYLNQINFSTPQLTIALLLFVVVVLIVFFLKQLSSVKQMYTHMLEKQTKIEEQQATVLSKMGEEIHTMTKDVIDNCENTTIIDEKTKLLDATNDLVLFLQLKSKKITISSQEFNINNVLNEISGKLGYKYQKLKKEIIFDIDNNIPRYLVGDSLYFGDAIYNILEHSIQHFTQDEIILHISQHKLHSNQIKLNLNISNPNAAIEKSELDMIFVPDYNEETNQYNKLGLFISHSLIELMHGKIKVTQNKQTGITFDLTIPFDIQQTNDLRRYHLPDKILINKKVLIVDQSLNAAYALKKMFAYFKNQIDVISAEHFIEKKPNFSNYDIVILDETQFNSQVISYLHNLKIQENIKIVSSHSILNIEQINYNHHIVDNTIIKPVNQERIFELIVNLYQSQDVQQTITNTKIKTYKEDIKPIPNITQQDFIKFENSHILIVEDNIINQKILTNIFHQVNIKTTIANNGQEALDILQKQPKTTFDLIIMDINMPVMDGFSATRAIRYNTNYDHIPIIALTALVLDSEIKKMFASGMNAYLPKPMNISTLYNALQLFLDKKTVTTTTTSKTNIDTIDSDILDTTQGIKYANNKLLYNEILNEFLEAYEHSAKTFETLIKEHRFEQLKFMCVDVKRLSAAIGARNLYKTMEKINKDIIFRRHEEFNNNLDIYKEELSKLISTIKLYITTNS